MNAIKLFNGDGVFAENHLFEFSANFLKLARKDRTFLYRFKTPRYFLTELYFKLKASGELPELSENEKRRIWKQSGRDRQLAFSLYLLEVV